MSDDDDFDGTSGGCRMNALSATEQERVDGKVRQLPTLAGLLSEADPNAYNAEQLTQAMWFVRDMIAQHPRTKEEVRRAQQQTQKQHRRVFKKSLLLTAYRQMLLCGVEAAAQKSRDTTVCETESACADNVDSSVSVPHASAALADRSNRRYNHVRTNNTVKSHANSNTGDGSGKDNIDTCTNRTIDGTLDEHTVCIRPTELRHVTQAGHTEPNAQTDIPDHTCKRDTDTEGEERSALVAQTQPPRMPLLGSDRTEQGAHADMEDLLATQVPHRTLPASSYSASSSPARPVSATSARHAHARQDLAASTKSGRDRLDGWTAALATEKDRDTDVASPAHSMRCTPDQTPSSAGHATASRATAHGAACTTTIAAHPHAVPSILCEPCPALEHFLVSKAPRSQSGVLVVTVFTSAYPNGQNFSCQWNCYYCPNEPGQPRSYLLNEPGVRRANKLDFDACRQFTERVQALRAIGHPTDKVEVLVLGGTWESYPADYRERFMRDVFYAANMITDNEEQSVGEEGVMGVTDRRTEVTVRHTKSATRAVQPSALSAVSVETASDEAQMAGSGQEGASLCHSAAQSRDHTNKNKSHGVHRNRNQGTCRDGATGTPSDASAVLHPTHTAHTTAPHRPPLDLLQEQLINETAYCRIIGVTLETRPDTITPAMLVDLRRMGCTRVQLGVQHTDDAILSYINRQATREDTVRALKLLKDSCFKVDIHLMPDLPGTTPAADRAMFDDVLHSPELQADQWKIYPCQTTPFTVIERWYREGKYRPYGLPSLIEVLLYVKRRVHPWVRLNRVVRDIPVDYVLAGVEVTNLRQLLARRMLCEGQGEGDPTHSRSQSTGDDARNGCEGAGTNTQESNPCESSASKCSDKEHENSTRSTSSYCRCIRCREVKGDGAVARMVLQAELKERRYAASEGEEVFLSYESADERVLFAFLRLRLNIRHALTPFAELKHCALIRELHVYGNLTTTHGGARTLQNRAQHRGLGSRLLQRAEAIAHAAGYAAVAVISGVGVRGYYAQKGYRMVDAHRGAFLIKPLDDGHTDSSRVHHDDKRDSIGNGCSSYSATTLSSSWTIAEHDEVGRGNAVPSASSAVDGALHCAARKPSDAHATLGPASSQPFLLSLGKRVCGGLHRWWQRHVGKRGREQDEMPGSSES